MLEKLFNRIKFGAFIEIFSAGNEDDTVEVATVVMYFIFYFKLRTFKTLEDV